MRILQVAPPWFAVPPPGYGGIEQVVSLLADGLADAGHDVTLLASGGSRTRARLRSVYQIPPSRQLGDAYVELPHVLDAYLHWDDYDLIHDHTGIGTALGAVAGGPPVVHTLHGPWTPTAARVYRTIADHVHLVAISHDQASRVPAGVRLAGVVHNGIRLDLFPPGAGDGGYLAYVGRASHEKGPEVAIEVARRVQRPLRMAIKVNEVQEQTYWRDVIAPRLDGADVRVLPPVTQAQKAALLGGAEAVLFPIHWPEPFGLVMVEANACGTPVVAFAEGAAPEVLNDGRTGLLVAPGDIDGFCAAVEQARHLDRAACRRHVARMFTARHMLDGYQALYERAVARPRAAMP